MKFWVRTMAVTGLLTFLTGSAASEVIFRGRETPPRQVMVGPTARIKATVDEVTAILRDKSARGMGHSEMERGRLRQTIKPLFDFNEMAKRSLGRYWTELTQEQRKAFVPLFTGLLEITYLARIESYSDEKIVYTGEKIEGSYAEVGSRIHSAKGDAFTVDYRLHRAENGWRIYDVVVENISMVNNYRSQFNRIISKSSYEDLVARLEQTIVQRDAAHPNG